MSEICTCTDDCALGFNPVCTCDECDCKNISNMIGKNRASIFCDICEYIDSYYQLDKTWKRQKIKTKKWKYEYKYSRGKKTFCGFYITDDCLGLMIILGKAERDKVEEAIRDYSGEFQNIYDSTKTYHDGKWIMFELNDLSLFEDIKRLLAIKRKPDK